MTLTHFWPRITSHQDSCESSALNSIVTTNTSLVVDILQPDTQYCFSVTAEAVSDLISRCSVALPKNRVEKLECEHSTKVELVLTTLTNSDEFRLVIPSGGRLFTNPDPHYMLIRDE